MMIAVQCFPQVGRRVNFRVTAWSLPTTASSLWSERRVVKVTRVATGRSEALRVIAEGLLSMADEMDAAG